MDTDLIARSLELTIEKTMEGPSAGDISPELYRRFYAASPESYELMSHMDPIQLGNMTAELIRLVMLTDYQNEQEYFNWEIENHRNAYSVMAKMYVDLLSSLTGLIKDTLAEDWNEDFEHAWQARSKLLLQEVHQRF